MRIINLKVFMNRVLQRGDVNLNMHLNGLDNCAKKVNKTIIVDNDPKPTTVQTSTLQANIRT